MSNLVAFGGGTGLISRESLANNLLRSAQALPTTGNGGAQTLRGVEVARTRATALQGATR